MPACDSTIRIGVIDPSPVLQYAIQCLVNSCDDMTFVMSAANGREGFQAVLS